MDNGGDGLDTKRPEKIQRKTFRSLGQRHSITLNCKVPDLNLHNGENESSPNCKYRHSWSKNGRMVVTCLNSKVIGEGTNDLDGTEEGNGHGPISLKPQTLSIFLHSNISHAVWIAYLPDHSLPVLNDMATDFSQTVHLRSYIPGMMRQGHSVMDVSKCCTSFHVCSRIHVALATVENNCPTPSQITGMQEKVEGMLTLFGGFVGLILCALTVLRESMGVATILLTSLELLGSTLKDDPDAWFPGCSNRRFRRIKTAQESLKRKKSSPDAEDMTWRVSERSIKLNYILLASPSGGCSEVVQIVRHLHCEKWLNVQRTRSLKKYNVGAPFERTAVDILGPFAVTDRCNLYLLVAQDYFTKWPKVTKILDMKKTRTTASHPQSDGMVKRLNRTLEQYLSIFVADNQKDWDVKVPLFLLAYHSAVHESTRVTPSRMLFGRELCLLKVAAAPDYGRELRNRLGIHDFAQQHLRMNSDRMKTRTTGVDVQPKKRTLPEAADMLENPYRVLQDQHCGLSDVKVLGRSQRCSTSTDWHPTKVLTLQSLFVMNRLEEGAVLHSYCFAFCVSEEDRELLHDSDEGLDNEEFQIIGPYRILEINDVVFLICRQSSRAEPKAIHIDQLTYYDGLKVAASVQDLQT
ncbi:hypothetical protein PR048_020598 [Dryococelus australis]|uniref:Integrase catalytic domain-containing protein n=1 Tax=Dryococelus australis TaxID=614101 RepID=A0ABQ9H6Q0_9NEOP|nr:hypothetical protein PR048_020598 [Dryococelus australis]